MGSTNEKRIGKKKSGLLSYRLNDMELESHLRIFLTRMPAYAALLGMEFMLLEQLKKEQLAFSWLLEMSHKLAGYTKEIQELQQSLKQTIGGRKPSLLKFYDLPRPPVFYPGGGLPELFGRAITLVKASAHYTPALGRELAIGDLVADNTGGILRLV